MRLPNDVLNTQDWIIDDVVPVDHADRIANAAQRAPHASVEKFREQRARFRHRQPVQIDFVLDHPVAAAQLLQSERGEAAPQEREFFSRFVAALPGRSRAQTVTQRRLLVEQALGCDRPWARPHQVGPVGTR